MCNVIYKVFSLLVASVTGLLLSACDTPIPEFEDPYGVPGIYTEPSGYVIILRANMRYQICDRSSCIEGLWVSESIKNEQYPEQKYVVSLKDVYKTALGLRMEMEVSYHEQYGVGTPERYARYVESSDYKDYVKRRLTDPYVDPTEKYALTGGILKCADIGAICLTFYLNRDFDNGFRKVASFAYRADQ